MSGFLATLLGGPFDGHAAELVVAPRKIVVARDLNQFSRLRIGDYEYNPPPWGAGYGVEVYHLDRLMELRARYVYAGLLTAIGQKHMEGRCPAPAR